METGRRFEMGKVMIIGTGSVGTVAAIKCAKEPEVFSEIMLVNRTYQKVQRLKNQLPHPSVQVAVADAGEPQQLINLIEKFRPELILNLALPALDLAIMEACVKTGVNYLDTANYERPEVIEFNHEAQLAFGERFKAAGICGLLGCGSDPGFASVFVAYARKHYFDQIDSVDLLDADSGEHGKAMAFNLNAAVKIRELMHPGKCFSEGRWETFESFSHSEVYDFPGLGRMLMFAIDHEELPYLVAHLSGLKRVYFWMSFSRKFIGNLKLLQAIGLTSIKPIFFHSREIVPLEFLERMFEESGLMVPPKQGKTWIGCEVRGQKNGQKRRCWIYNLCDHEKCQAEVGLNAIPYTAGVGAAIGAKLMMIGVWQGAGVFTADQFDPDPYLAEMPKQGLSVEIKLM